MPKYFGLFYYKSKWYKIIKNRKIMEELLSEKKSTLKTNVRTEDLL